MEVQGQLRSNRPSALDAYTQVHEQTHVRTQVCPHETGQSSCSHAVLYSLGSCTVQHGSTVFCSGSPTLHSGVKCSLQISRCPNKIYIYMSKGGCTLLLFAIVASGFTSGSEYILYFSVKSNQKCKLIYSGASFQVFNKFLLYVIIFLRQVITADPYFQFFYYNLVLVLPHLYFYLHVVVFFYHSKFFNSDKQ